MNREGFQKYLKRGGRSPSAVQRAVNFVEDYETYLKESKNGKGLDQADEEDLADYVTSVESEPKTFAKLHLWAIRYYYTFTENEHMAYFAGILRQERIQRTPFKLKDFMGVNQEYAAALERAGIKNVNQMLREGRTAVDRQKLSQETGVPVENILEFVKLSDLARIPGIKGVRARLYYDAGVDTIEVMAGYEPEELLEVTRAFVERTRFDGIAPLPAEARSGIKKARQLPSIVEYEE